MAILLAMVVYRKISTGNAIKLCRSILVSFRGQIKPEPHTVYFLWGLHPPPLPLDGGVGKYMYSAVNSVLSTLQNNLGDSRFWTISPGLQVRV